MSTYAALNTLKERRAQAAKLLKQNGFHKCGLCGMKVRVTKTSLRADGSHWHSDCWSVFLKG